MFMRTFFAHHAMYRSRKITQYMEVPSREFNIFVTFACRLFQKLDDMPPTANCRKRKRNGQFIRNKCKNKRRRVSLAERETKAKNITETSDETESPERTPGRAKCCWRDGRRIVELGFLADQLKAGCSECKKTLNIINTVDETTQGLGSILYIQCEECSQLNAVKTGKTHRSPAKKSVGRPIWDINTKAATGS